MTDTNRELIQKWADLWSGTSKADFLGIFQRLLSMKTRPRG